MKQVNYIITAVLLVSGLLFSNQSSASAKLYYAGIAYMGNYSAKNTLYKFSSRLIDDDERLLQETLVERLKSIDNESFEVIIGAQPVDYKKEDALTMAFALEYENVSIEKIGGVYKMDIDLRANILVFDYNEMKIVASYPIAVQLRDASESTPTDSYLKSVIRELYISNKFKLNIFDEFVNRLTTLELKTSYSNTIKVSKVTITDDSKLKIPGIERLYEEDAYETLLAQMFSTYLSKNQNVSVLPYTKGHAIGNKMALQIANGDVYNLEIPKETYAIELELINLKKANLGGNEYKSIWGYASYLGIKLLIPGDNDVLMNAKFRGLVKKSILRSSPHTVNDWSIYKESMYRLVDSFTKNISEQDDDWLASVTATKNIADQLEVFNDKIASCQ